MSRLDELRKAEHDTLYWLELADYLEGGWIDETRRLKDRLEQIQREIKEIEQ